MSSLDEFLTQEPINYYCNVNSPPICRLCLEKHSGSKKMCDIFDGAEPFATMIMSCASVQILQGDGFPNTICHKCLAKLNVAWQFKLQCESSDSRLRQFYTNSNVLDDMGNVSDATTTGFINDVKNSFTFEEQSSVNTTSQIQDPVVVVDEFLKQVGTDCGSGVKLESRKMKKKGNTSPSLRNKEIKIHQCDTCGKIFNRREYLTQHIRIHTGEKPYCCHICDKRFINSGHLSTHMRTHTGERPHACSLCPKTFSTRQELRKHTMVHNGERPFVCTSCGKCFGSSSNLYSHLKHHTGEKNFTCEHCGKAFYTKQELKQHLVIHTGEKPYCCQFCTKKFSQSAHLRRHLKLHT